MILAVLLLILSGVSYADEYESPWLGRVTKTWLSDFSMKKDFPEKVGFRVLTDFLI